MSRRKTRKAKAVPRERVSAAILPEVLGHGNFRPEPAEIAGQFVAVKREGAHRRLAREKRISGDAETAVMKYIEDFEAAEGAKQYEGAGGADGNIVTSRMLAAERVRLADERMGLGGRHVLVAACVFCHKPEDICRFMLGFDAPDCGDVVSRYLRDPSAAHRELDRQMDMFRKRSTRHLDKYLIPIIERLCGERKPLNLDVDRNGGSGHESDSLQDVALEAVDQESP